MSGLGKQIRSGFKPFEVEEYIDYFYHRPLAGLLVQLLLRHGASQSIPDEAGKVARDVATPEAAAALPPSLPELGIL